MRQVLFILLFVAAVALLSAALGTGRTAAADPSAGAVLRAVLAWGSLAAVVAAMGFLMYAADRAAGTVRRRIRPYEWILTRRAPGA